MRRQNTGIETFIRDTLRSAVADPTDAVTAQASKRPLLVTGSQGTGKTTAALATILEFGWSAQAPWTVWFMVPTVAKAQEAQGEFVHLARELKVSPPPSLVMKGRGARISEDSSETMCRRPRAAQRLGEANLPVSRLLCESREGGKCQHIEDCAYRRQTSCLRESVGGVVFLAHEYAWLGLPGPKPDLVIIDESVIPKATWKVAVPVSRLIEGPTRSDETGLVWSFGADLAECLREPNNLQHVRDRIGRDRLAAMRDALDDFESDALPELCPTMADDQIIASLDAQPRDGRSSLTKLLDAILREYDAPRPSFNAVWTGQRRGQDGDPEEIILCGGLKPLTLPPGASLLLLDGTGNPVLNQCVFGDLEHLHVPVPRDAWIEQVSNRIFSRQSLTGRGRDGAPLSNRAVAEAAALLGDVMAVADRQRGPLFVGTYKAVAEVIKDAPGQTRDKNVLVGHFGALRGINAYSHCRTAVVLGRQQPPASAVEAETRPFLAADPMPVNTSATYVKECRYIRMRSGGVRPVDVEVHPDSRVQAMLEQIREAEMLQTVDRVRCIFQHRHIIILSSVVLDITVDRVMSWSDMKNGGNRFMRTWDAHGILPLSPKDLAVLSPDLFPGADAAKKALKAAKAEASIFGEETPIEWLIGTPPPYLHVRYKRRGARGANARVEAFIASTISNPRGALENLVGPLDDFEVIDAMPEVLLVAAE